MAVIQTINGNILTTGSLNIAATQSIGLSLGATPYLYLTSSKIGIGNNLNPQYSLDTTGDNNVSGNYRVGGNILSDNNRNIFAASISSSNSVWVAGSVTAPSFTGSFSGSIGTAAYASSSTYAQTASYLSGSYAFVTSLTSSGIYDTGNAYIGGNLTLSGNFTMQGSGSVVNITSSAVDIGTNVILVNAYSPFQRYAGISAIDSGSATPASSSLLWDSLKNRWIFQGDAGVYGAIQSSSVIIGGPVSSIGNETQLTQNTIPKALTGLNIGDSLLTDNGTILNYAGTGFSASYITVANTISASALSSNTLSTNTTYATTVNATSITASGISGVTSISATSITASLLGTASWANNAVTAYTASFVNAGNITLGTLSNSVLPSQINVTGVTASLLGTSSWSTYSLSSSIGINTSAQVNYLTFVVNTGSNQALNTNQLLNYNSATNKLYSYIVSSSGITTPEISGPNGSQIDMNNGLLQDSAATNTSLNWNTRTLVGYGGTAITVDWTNRFLSGSWYLSGSITGSVAGTSSWSTYSLYDSIVTASANQNYYIEMVSGSSGSQLTYTDLLLTFNPSTNVLISPTISSSLFTGSQININGLSGSVAILNSLSIGNTLFTPSLINTSGGGSTFTASVGSGANGSQLQLKAGNGTGFASLTTSNGGLYVDGNGNISASNSLYSGNATITTLTASTELVSTLLVTSTLTSPTVSASLFTGSQIIVTSTTSSFTGSLVGALIGTSSWANNATSASYSKLSTTASYALNSSYPDITDISGQFVGIFNSNPKSPLDVVGNISLTGMLINTASSLVSGNSNFIGTGAGAGNPSVIQSNFIGLNAGSGATTSNYSNFIGTAAGFNSSNTPYSNFIGVQAGANSTNANSSNFIGYYAGQITPYAVGSNFLGYQAGLTATSASNSNFIGYNAGNAAATANNSIFIGNSAGQNDTVNNISNTGSSILIGDYTSTKGFSNSIAIGRGTSNTASAQLNLGNLIWVNGIYTGSATYSQSVIGGKVGIGLTTPVNSLDVIGNISCSVITASLHFGTSSYAFTSSWALNAVNGGTTLVTGSTYPITSSWSNNSVSSSYSSTSSYIGLGSTGYVPIWNGNTLTSTSSIYQSGSNVGIGTLTPSQPLSVNGNLYVNGNIVAVTTSGTGTTGIGTGAGGLSQNASYSNFMGYNSGGSATSASYSNMLGYYSGVNATNASGSNFIGYYAGSNASNSNNSNFIGYQVGFNATNANGSNFIGYIAGNNANNASQSNFIGYSAGGSATTSNAALSNFIGYYAGYNSSTANNSIFIGSGSGYNDTVNNSTGGSSILIGDNTSTKGFSNSIAIGKGTANSASAQFNIGNLLIGNGIYTGGTPSTASVIGGRIGIGTFNPVNALDVIGNIS